MMVGDDINFTRVHCMCMNVECEHIATSQSFFHIHQTYIVEKLKHSKHVTLSANKHTLRCCTAEFFVSEYSLSIKYVIVELMIGTTRYCNVFERLSLTAVVMVYNWHLD